MTYLSRVTPGRTTSSKGGVTSSTVPSACLSATKRFIVPTFSSALPSYLLFLALAFPFAPLHPGLGELSIQGRTSVKACSSPNNHRFWLYPSFIASFCGTIPGA